MSENVRCPACDWPFVDEPDPTSGAINVVARTRMEALERDAARYRFIRDNLAQYLKNKAVDPVEAARKFWYVEDLEGPTFDAAIDSLIAAKTG